MQAPETAEKPVKRLTRVYPVRVQKIDILENELYRRAIEGELNNDEILAVLQTLQDNQNQECLIRIKDSNTPFGLVFTAFQLFVIVIFIGLFLAAPCRNSRSPFCQQINRLPESIGNMFKEPATPKVLPTNLP